MYPWIAKALVLAGTVVLMAIRAPHGHRSRSVKVATSYKTPLETGLLVLAWVGFFLPLTWVASPAFSFAEYALGTSPLVAGVMCLVIGLWLFYRSHAKRRSERDELQCLAFHGAHSGQTLNWSVNATYRGDS
jgi:hypothetical protein